MKASLPPTQIDQLLYDYLLPDQQAQELGFSLEREPWNSLAVVPAAAGASTANIVKSLKEVAELRGLASVQTMDCNRVGLSEVGEAQSRLQTFGALGHKVIFNS